jgi:two-component system response regulator MprA
VLVVDDDPILRRSIAETLQESGYRVIGARDGVDALRVLSRTAPWLILLDIYLPMMNGADFVRELRQRGITTRIVVITASRDASAWAERLEAADFLRKPFEMVDVLQAVERYRPDSPTS